jgi:hypothetical protein
MNDHQMPPSDVEVLALRVTLNGTERNPWHTYGLRQNPFPQLGKAEYHAGERQLASLDGDPLRGPHDIRARLRGFSEEFIELCIAQFRPGRRVSFTVVFPAAREEIQ